MSATESASSDGATTRHGRPLGWAAPVLVLASGFSALVYEVLWLHDLTLLFGNTAHASAVGFAVFFAGLAAGSRCWGQRAGRLRRPLVTYAWLEVGVAITAAANLWLTDLHQALYGLVDAGGRFDAATLLLVRTLLAFVILFPPAFLMGGSVPLMGEVTIQGSGNLGRRAAILYGLNTAGAAAGALAAGFFLPAALGFRGAYLVAMAVNVGIAGMAGLLAVGHPQPALRDRGASTPRQPRQEDEAPGPRLVPTLAAASGFLTLVMEVASARLFAQVLQNSVYTFSTILVTLLAAFTAGSLIASAIAGRAHRTPWAPLALVLTAAGVAAAAVPLVFHEVTDGATYLASTEGWRDYVTAVFSTALLVLGVPATITGIVFPLLPRLVSKVRSGSGRILGTLAAWNTLGAILGSLTTAFVLLPSIGLWNTFTLAGTSYLGLASVLLLHRRETAGLLRIVPAAALLPVAILQWGERPLLQVDTTGGERVLDIRESAYGITAVVERGRDRRIKVNNHYSLGGSGSVAQERNQALLPLLIHPDPRRVFFIGLGTGITAGAAVQPTVERLVVTELIPDVARAAREHFAHLANGLFDDSRVEIVVADGRHHLSGRRESHDLVIADLFVPWEAGTGSLYTREHFGMVRQRLAPRGLFVQWLPLYQMSRQEFLIIARTMLDTFPHVLLWRGDFFAERPIVALVASVDPPRLDPAVIAARGSEIARGPLPADAVRATTLPFYAGNLSRAPGLIPPGPINTDDRPLIEYTAPVTQREQRAGAARWFSSRELMTFMRELLRAVPPESDPYLALLDEPDRQWVVAGFHYHAAAVYRALGEDEAAGAHMREFDRRVAPPYRPSPAMEPTERIAE